jgi:hypothetical protein
MRADHTYPATLVAWILAGPFTHPIPHDQPKAPATLLVWFLWFLELFWFDSRPVPEPLVTPLESPRFDIDPLWCPGDIIASVSFTPSPVLV